MARTITVTTDSLSLLPSGTQRAVSGFQPWPHLSFLSLPEGEVERDEWQLARLFSRLQNDPAYAISQPVESPQAIEAMFDWMSISAATASRRPPGSQGQDPEEALGDGVQSLHLATLTGAELGTDAGEDRFGDPLAYAFRQGLQRGEFFGVRNSPWKVQSLRSSGATTMANIPGVILVASDGVTTASIVVTTAGLFVGYVVVPVVRSVGRGAADGLKTVVREWTLTLRPRPRRVIRRQPNQDIVMPPADEDELSGN